MVSDVAFLVVKFIDPFQINIGLMLHTKGDSKNSQKFLESALKLHKKFHGTGSVQVRREEFALRHFCTSVAFLTFHITELFEQFTVRC